jgi:amyloid beta precursor protein binding protein 1
MHIFVKKSKGAVALRTTSIAEEYSVSEQVTETLMSAVYDTTADPQQTPFLWYLALRGVDAFHASKARWPGDSSNTVLTQDQEEVYSHMVQIASSYGFPSEMMESLTNDGSSGSTSAQMDTSDGNDVDGQEGQGAPLLTRQHAQEITRYGGAELHTISALIGGMAAQEIVKVLTNLYVPLDNTYVFNGVAATGAAYKF